MDHSSHHGTSHDALETVPLTMDDERMASDVDDRGTYPEPPLGWKPWSREDQRRTRERSLRQLAMSRSCPRCQEDSYERLVEQEESRTGYTGELCPRCSDLVWEGRVPGALDIRFVDDRKVLKSMSETMMGLGASQVDLSATHADAPTHLRRRHSWTRSTGPRVARWGGSDALWACPS